MSGYKNIKPLPEHQFKKGQSGNPKGRPKGKTISSFLKELGNATQIKYTLEITDANGKKKTQKVNVKSPDSKTPINQIAASVLLTKALTGDLKAMDMLLDRTEGKAKQTVENTGSLDLTSKGKRLAFKNIELERE